MSSPFQKNQRDLISAITRVRKENRALALEKFRKLQQERKGQKKEGLEERPRRTKKELEEEVNVYRQARSEVIGSCFPIVTGIAGIYSQNTSRPYSDLGESAHRGLIKAIDRFASNTDRDFSDYVFWWVEESVKWTIAAGLDLSTEATVEFVANAVSEYREAFGQEPIFGEICDLLNISGQRLRQLMETPGIYDKIASEKQEFWSPLFSTKSA